MSQNPGKVFSPGCYQAATGIPQPRLIQHDLDYSDSFFLLRYMLLGLRSLVSRAFAYQRAGRVAAQFQWPSWADHCEATKFPSRMEFGSVTETHGGDKAKLSIVNTSQSGCPSVGHREFPRPACARRHTLKRLCSIVPFLESVQGILCSVQTYSPTVY